MAPDLGKMSMPKSVQTQIHWFTADYSLAVNLNATSVTEANLAFSLSSLAGGFATPLVTLFDQYAIFAAYVRVSVSVAGLLATAVPVYCTALDYDNVNNINTLSNIQAYSTVCETSLNEVQERYIEPCNAPALYSGSTFTHYGQSRMWVDATNPGTPHYGFRCLVAPTGTGSSGILNQTVSLIVCARNSI
jgi:hypothetical protein